jgi:hypothetical protein
MPKATLGKVTISSDEPKLQAALGAERYDIKDPMCPGEKTPFNRPDQVSEKNNLDNSPGGVGDRTASSPSKSSVSRSESSRPDLHNMDGSVA